MIYFIFLLILFVIIFVIYFIVILIKSKNNVFIESFYTNNKNKNKETIVLLGDSILKNNSYVENGQAVDSILTKKSNSNVFSYSEDGSTITDVYRQLDEIPLELNEKTTTIYISIGGNDILSQYVDKITDLTNMTRLTIIFSKYVTLIESIKTRFHLCKIVLLDIYYPKSTIYRVYYSIIKKWNEMIYDYTNNTKNNILILKISDILTQENDFVFNIEPSNIGGVKIVNSILSLQ
jgi:lysophospholipase L1-like esterase